MINDCNDPFMGKIATSNSNKSRLLCLIPNCNIPMEPPISVLLNGVFGFQIFQIFKKLILQMQVCLLHYFRGRCVNLKKILLPERYGTFSKQFSIDDCTLNL